MDLFIHSRTVFLAGYGSLREDRAERETKWKWRNTDGCYEFLLNLQIFHIVWMFTDNWVTAISVCLFKMNATAWSNQINKEFALVWGLKDYFFVISHPPTGNCGFYKSRRWNSFCHQFLLEDTEQKTADKLPLWWLTPKNLFLFFIYLNWQWSELQQDRPLWRNHLPPVYWQIPLFWIRQALSHHRHQGLGSSHQLNLLSQ